LISSGRKHESELGHVDWEVVFGMSIKYVAAKTSGTNTNPIRKNVKMKISKYFNDLYL